jgi:hypothetical protein
MKWCPQNNTEEGEMGLLAAVFSDGTVRVFTVPLPSNQATPDYCIKMVPLFFFFSSHEAVLIKEPLLTCRMEYGECTCISWKTEDEIVVGCANGIK